jgi:hypothetical protein
MKQTADSLWESQPHGCGKEIAGSPQRPGNAGDSGRARTCDLPLRRRLPSHNGTYPSRNIISLI